jgi:hypothetical protein
MHLDVRRNQPGDQVTRLSTHGADLLTYPRILSQVHSARALLHSWKHPGLGLAGYAL